MKESTAVDGATRPTDLKESLRRKIPGICRVRFLR